MEKIGMKELNEKMRKTEGKEKGREGEIEGERERQEDRWRGQNKTIKTE